MARFRLFGFPLRLAIMGVMKRLLFLLCGSGLMLSGAELAGVHTVYLLPMSRGLDQYLANRLTNEHLFQVVTDPKLADAVLSDNIGDSFQTQMDTLYPKPPEKPAAKEVAPSKEGAKKDATKAAAPAPVESSQANLMTDTVNKLSAPSSTFGHSKGMVFLVDAKSHLVLWSTYEPPKGTAGNDMDRAATGIVTRLKKELYPKAK